MSDTEETVLQDLPVTVQSRMFLDALGGVEGKHCFQSFSDKSDKSLELVRQFFGDFGEFESELRALNDRGAGIYYCLNATDGHGREAKNVTALRALAIDSDGVDFDSIEAKLQTLYPSIITGRSQTHYHCVWLLKPDEDMSRFKTAVQHLAKFFGTDPKICDLPRVLRLPGTNHMKTDSPIPWVMWHCDETAKYSIDEILAAFPLPEVSAPAPMAASASHPNGSQSLESDYDRAYAYLSSVPAATPGERNSTLNAIAFRLMENFRLSREEHRELCIDWARSCFSKEEMREVERTIRSAFESAHRDGVVGSKHRPLHSSPLVRRLTAPPVKLPTFPDGLLPDWLELMKNEVTRSLEVPADLAGMCALGVLATCFQKKFTARVGEGYSEPLSLFLVCGLEPGSRKSAVFSLFMKPVHDYERNERERLAPEIVETERKRDLLLKQISSLQTKLAKRKTLQFEADLDACYKQLDALRVPVSPLLTVDDVTTEALAPHLAAQGGRLTVASAEGAFLEILRGRYSEAPAIETCLQCHAGDVLKVHRAAKDKTPIIVQQPALTLALCVQPNLISELAQNTTLAGRGMLSRTIFVEPRSTLGERTHDQPPVDKDVMQHYDNCITALLQLTEERDDSGEIRAEEIPCDDDVRKARQEFCKRIEIELKPGGRLRDESCYLSGFAGKVAGMAIRVAGLLALADGRRNVIAADFARGRVFAEYAVEHAIAISGRLADRSTSQKERLAGAIRQAGADGLSRTEISRLFSHTSSTRIDCWLDELRAEELITMNKIQSANGGRATERWVWIAEQAAA